MLPRTERLRTKEVEVTIQLGRSARAGVLSLKYAPTPGHSRCAVVVSKKVAKKATDRNNLRRRVYAALERVVLPKNIAAVFFVQRIPPTPRVATFTQDILQLCSNIS